MLLICGPTCRAADPWDIAAAELSRQIAGVTGPATISLTIRDNSSIYVGEIPTIRRSLVSNLSALGVNVRTGTDPPTAVRVTLSQTARQGLWVAEVQQGPELRVVMTYVANAVESTTLQETPVVLRKRLLFSQTEPILDVGLVALSADAPAVRNFVVLSPEEIAIYHGAENGGVWVKDRSVAIPHGRPYPRDIRGRLQLDPGGTLKAYLPGVVCESTRQTAASGADLAVTCADNDDPWPIGSLKAVYNSSRNYFTGMIVPGAGGDAQPFYSVAELAGKRGAVTIFSEVGGQFRVSDSSGIKALAGSRDWGSDIVGVRSECGAGAQLLATGSGIAMADNLLAYEVTGHEAIAVSAPLPLDGQVTAMWPSSLPGTATLIVQKKQPIQYEAYGVSLVCSQ
jgi:hypothetical protein